MAFSYYKQVTIDHTQCGATDSTNFPVTIFVTDADLKTVGNSGFVQSANGYDIRPFSNSTLTTALDFELVVYTASSGKLEMYVRIPTVSHTVDTIFYLAFGDASITTDGTVTTTWNSNYMAVYHLGDGTTLSLNDSTSNANTLTNVNTVTATGGQLGGGALFTAASTNYLTRAANAAATTLPITYEAWFNTSSSASTQAMVTQSDLAGNALGAELDLRGTNSQVRVLTPSVTFADTANNSYTLNTWHQGTAIVNTVSDRTIYADGTGAVNTTTTSATPVMNSIAIGARKTTAASQFYSGIIDEVRISAVALSADWILTQFNNQKASSTFLTFASKTAVGIAFDAASNSTYQAASSSYSWSHTCTGSNRYLVVGIAMLSVAQTVSSITYNSVALTLLGVRSSLTGAARVELWGLVAPSTGSNTIAVTLTGSIASAGVAESYTGVHQTSPTEGFNSNQATNVGAADATVTVTTVANNDWIVDIVATDDTSITVGAGQTQRNNVTGAGGSGADSDKGPISPAAATAMSWTNIGALSTWSYGAIALRPITASNLTTSTTFLSLLGVGT